MKNLHNTLILSASLASLVFASAAFAKKTGPEGIDATATLGGAVAAEVAPAAEKTGAVDLKGEGKHARKAEHKGKHHGKAHHAKKDAKAEEKHDAKKAKADDKKSQPAK